MGPMNAATRRHLKELEAKIERDKNIRGAAFEMYEALQQAAAAIPTTHGAFETVRKALAKADGRPA